VTAVTPLPAARTVIVPAPAAAVVPTLNTSVALVAVPVSGVGVKAAVTPVGKFSAVSDTAPV